MSDERLRELEREAAQGDPVAKVAFMRERIRVGLLSPEKARLAAYLGDPTAVAVTGGHENQDDADLVEWAPYLAKFGREACVRIALAASRVALKHWIASADGPKKDCPHCDGGQVYCSRCSSYGCRGPCDRCDGHGKQPDDNPPAAQALRAAQDWLDIPADEEERAAMQASAGAGREWATLTAMLCYRNMKEETVADAIRAALEDAPEAEIRDAIKGTIAGFLA